MTLTAALFFATSASARPATDSELQERVQNSIEKHVLPNLLAFKNATNDLNNKFADHCKSQHVQSGTKTWLATNKSFSKAVAAWAKVHHLRFGPMIASGRLQRVALWPDPRGITARQLNRTLRDENQDILKPGKLKNYSAALQGLTALEYLLIDKLPSTKPATTSKKYACALATAISENLFNTATEIHNGWIGPDGWTRNMRSPGPHNNHYLNHKEAAAQFVKAFLAGAKILHDRQIAPLLRTTQITKQEGAEKNTNETQIRRQLLSLPFFRSHQSKVFLKNSVIALKELAKELRLQEFAPKNKEWLAAWLPTAFDQLEAGAANIELPTLANIATTALNVSDLRKMNFYAGGLTSAFAKHLAPAAGLTIGFNELDGD